MVLTDVNCENLMLDIEATNIDTFLRELKNDHTGKVDEVVLMFYIEGGEVIDFYSIAILVLDEEAKIAVYKDNQQLETKLEKKYSGKHLNSFLASIEEKEAFNQRKLLVTYFQKDSVSCNKYQNLKKTSGEELKNYHFLIRNTT